MSKNIRKKPTAAAVDQAIKASDAEQNRLDARDHEFGDSTRDLGDAPVGLQTAPASAVTGPNVFDAIEGLSSTGQISALRSIANGAICGAVFAANQFLSEEDDDDKRAAAHLRMAEQAELYSYAAQCLRPLVQNQFDRAMSLADAIDFASSSAADQRRNDELPDEVLEALGVSRSQVAILDAEEQRKQKARDAKLREQFRVNAADIAAEVGSFVDVDNAGYEVLNRFTVVQHQSLFQRTLKKLSARVGQLIAIRGKYQGALGDAMLVSADVKTLDKAYLSFAKANAGELREAMEA